MSSTRGDRRPEHLADVVGRRLDTETNPVAVGRGRNTAGRERVTLLVHCERWIVSQGEDAFDSIAHHAEELRQVAEQADAEVVITWTELPHR
ncbi:hypothetical protein [Blastococcus sp. Marseille-P5729]|uniref:hypothetical protein n=1 Tax=Blastococcus sp. Marseille-P5729 TaxID=2086582 RepID=UPI00131C572F|nr:hypothetical protein [Blastococcus sp. Marseille-P5729]